IPRPTQWTFWIIPTQKNLSNNINHHLSRERILNKEFKNAYRLPCIFSCLYFRRFFLCNYNSF
ncbi:unnamed protein product, partial [Schistosoma mattheei]